MLIEIRLLKPNDFEAYIHLREQALANVPEAFGASEAREAPLRKSRFEAMQKSTSNFIVGAFADGQLVGMVGYLRNSYEKLKHKGAIWGVYLEEAYRGQKISSQMLRKAVDKAFDESDIRLIQLGVGSANHPAIKLYANVGFDVYGVEKEGLFVNGKYIDEYLMVKFRDGLYPKKEEVVN